MSLYRLWLRRRETGGQVSGSHSANLFDLIAARAPHADKLALETSGATGLTYGELFERSARAANALVKLGVEAGDRVAAQIDKSTDAIVLTLACLRAGSVLLPLNTAYTLVELEYFLADAEPALTLCRPNSLEPVRALAQKLGLRAVESLGVNRDGTFAEAIAGRRRSSRRSRAEAPIWPRSSTPQAPRGARRARCSATRTSRRTR